MFFFSFGTHKKATSRRFNIFEINNVWIEDVCVVIRMNEMCAIISSADLVLLLLVLLSVVNLYHTTDIRTHTAAINKKKKFRVSVLSVWIVRSNWRQTPPKCLCACVFACTSLIFTQMRKERLFEWVRVSSFFHISDSPRIFSFNHFVFWRNMQNCGPRTLFYKIVIVVAAFSVYSMIAWLAQTK